MSDWIKTLNKSEENRQKGEKFKKQAGTLLWDGARAAIEEWDSTADNMAEGLAEAVKDALGGDHRKGDASKIKTVALAFSEKGLVLGDYGNLSKAYAAAVALTKTAKKNEEEDHAADEATSSIDAPKTSSKPEGAALIVMKEGVDEAARLLLNALGEDNDPAHKAFLRAITQEITGRKTAKVEAEKAAKQAAREAAKEEKEADKPKAKAAPKVKAAPKKKAEAEVEAEAEATDIEYLFDEMTGDEAVEAVEAVEVEPEAVEVEQPAKPKRAVPRRAVPVRK